MVVLALRYCSSEIGSDVIRGRPRDAETDERIVAAARTLLMRDGYHAVSIAAVARDADVARTTVYRRWPAKQHLVLDVVARLQAAVPVPDSGDWRADVLTLATAVARSLRALGPAMVADLAAAAASDPALADGVHALWAGRKGMVVERVPRPDAALLVDQIFGALYYRVLVTGEPVPDDYVGALVASVLDRVPVR